MCTCSRNILYRFTIIFILITVTLTTSNISPRARIVNGEPTTNDEYPFIVSLRFIQNLTNTTIDHHQCGGSIIRSDPLAVLTAAHCIDDLNGTDDTFELYADIGRTTVITDDIDELFERYEMLKFIIHPEYATDAFEQQIWNDVAIIFFDGNTEIKSIMLNNNANLNLTGITLRGIGYGRSEFGGELTDTLEYADFVYMDDMECNKGLTDWANKSYDAVTLELLKQAYGINDDEYPWDILQQPQGQICVINSNSTMCNGDSGGPLIYIFPNGTVLQIGLSSFGTDCELNYPSIFTDVSSYYQWIQDTLNSFPSGVNISTTFVLWNDTLDTEDEGETDHHDHDHTGIIIGSVVGVFFAIILILMCIYLIKYNKNPHHDDSPTNVYSKSDIAYSNVKTGADGDGDDTDDGIR